MKTKQLKAWCDRRGHIKFGVRIPKGRLLLGVGPEQKLRDSCEVLARWSYPSERGGNDSIPLVPGIPEAKTDAEALAAVEWFSDAVDLRLRQ